MGLYPAIRVNACRLAVDDGGHVCMELVHAAAAPKEICCSTSVVALDVHHPATLISISATAQKHVAFTMTLFAW